jgi:hypothetical protein
MRPVFVGLSMLLAALSAAPARADDSSACVNGTKPMLVAELFFGRSLGAHRVVSDRQWDRFVRDVMGPAFPGFTALDAAGQYTDPATHRLVREPTKYVIVALDDAPRSRETLDRVTVAYASRFRQNSVGLLLTHRCGKF